MIPARATDQPSAFEREALAEYDAWFRASAMGDAAVLRMAFGAWAVRLWEWIRRG